MKIGDTKGPNFAEMAKEMSPINASTFNKATLEKNPEMLKGAVTDAKSLIGKLASPPAGQTGVNKQVLAQLESRLAHIAQMVSLAQV